MQNKVWFLILNKAITNCVYFFFIRILDDFGWLQEVASIMCVCVREVGVSD